MIKGELRRLEKRLDKVLKYEDEMAVSDRWAAVLRQKNLSNVIKMVKRLINSCNEALRLYARVSQTCSWALSSHTRFRLWWYRSSPRWRSRNAYREGKTLTATMPVYLNALSGKGVHCSYRQRIPYRTWRDWDGWVVLMAWFVAGINLAAKINGEQLHSDITYSTKFRDWFWLPSWQHGCTCREHGSTSTFFLTMPWSMRLTHLGSTKLRTPLIVQEQMPLKRVNPLPYGGPFCEVLIKDDYIIDIQSKTIGLSIQVLIRATTFQARKPLW